MAGGMSGLTGPEQDWMRQRMLMTMGARMLGGAGSGENTAKTMGAAMMSGLDASDELLKQGLATQMQNRNYQLQRERNDLLTREEDRNLAAGRKLRAQFKEQNGGEPLSAVQELMVAGVESGQGSYMAGQMLGNPYASGMMDSSPAATDDTTTATTNPNAPQGPSDRSFLENLHGYFSSPHNPLQPYGQQFGQWAYNQQPQGQSFGDVLAGTAKEIPNTLSKAWDATTNFLAPVTQGFQNLGTNLSNAQTAYDEKVYPYRSKMPEFTQEGTGLNMTGARSVYETIARGGQRAYEQALMSGRWTKEQREYAISLMEHLTGQK